MSKPQLMHRSATRHASITGLSLRIELYFMDHEYLPVCYDWNGSKGFMQFEAQGVPQSIIENV